jgi:hypothetical protein
MSKKRGAEDEQTCQTGGNRPTAPARKPFFNGGAEHGANFISQFGRSLIIRDSRTNRVMKLLVLLTNLPAIHAIRQMTLELQGGRHIEFSINVSVQEFAHFLTAH